jgi:hypothetical protein
MAIGTPSACAAPSGFPTDTSITSSALTTSAGDLLVGFTRWEGGDTSCAFSDGSGATWTSLTTQTLGGTVCMGYAIAGSGQTNNTVTATFGASRDALQIAFCRVTGIDSTPLDDDTGGTGNSTAVDAGSLTTATADTILFLFGTAFGDVSASNWFGGSGTELIDTNSVFYVGYRIVASTGTYDPTCTIGSQEWAAVAAAFKGASSGTQTITGASTVLSPSAGAATVTTGAVTVTGSSNVLSPTAGAATVTTGAVTVTGSSNVLGLSAGAATVTTGEVTVSGGSNVLDLTAGAATVAVAGGPQTVTGTSTVLDLSAGAGTVSATYEIAAGSNALSPAAGAATVTPGAVTVTGGSNVLAATAGAATVAVVASGAAVLSGASTTAAARRTGTVARGGPTTAARGVTSTTTTLGRTTTRARGE